MTSWKEALCGRDFSVLSGELAQMVTRGGIYLDSNKTSGKFELEVYTHPHPRRLVDGQIAALATNLRVVTMVMSRLRLEKFSGGVNGVCIYWNSISVKGRTKFKLSSKLVKVSQ